MQTGYITKKRILQWSSIFWISDSEINSISEVEINTYDLLSNQRKHFLSKCALLLWKMQTIAKICLLLLLMLLLLLTTQISWKSKLTQIVHSMCIVSECWFNKNAIIVLNRRACTCCKNDDNFHDNRSGDLFTILSANSDLRLIAEQCPGSGRCDRRQRTEHFWAERINKANSHAELCWTSRT